MALAYFRHWDESIYRKASDGSWEVNLGGVWRPTNLSKYYEEDLSRIDEDEASRLIAAKAEKPGLLKRIDARVRRYIREEGWFDRGPSSPGG